jgi:hypothetical protein
MSLDGARDPNHDRFIDPMTADIEIHLGILKLPDDQSLDIAVHRFPRWWC